MKLFEARTDYGIFANALVAAKITEQQDSEMLEQTSEGQGNTFEKARTWLLDPDGRSGTHTLLRQSNIRLHSLKMGIMEQLGISDVDALAIVQQLEDAGVVEAFSDSSGSKIYKRPLPSLANPQPSSDEPGVEVGAKSAQDTAAQHMGSVPFIMLVTDPDHGYSQWRTAPVLDNAFNSAVAFVRERNGVKDESVRPVADNGQSFLLSTERGLMERLGIDYDEARNITSRMIKEKVLTPYMQDGNLHYAIEPANIVMASAPAPDASSRQQAPVSADNGSGAATNTEILRPTPGDDTEQKLDALLAQFDGILNPNGVMQPPATPGARPINARPTTASDGTTHSANGTAADTITVPPGYQPTTVIHIHGGNNYFATGKHGKVDARGSRPTVGMTAEDVEAMVRRLMDAQNRSAEETEEAAKERAAKRNGHKSGATPPINPAAPANDDDAEARRNTTSTRPTTDLDDEPYEPARKNREILSGKAAAVAGGGFGLLALSHTPVAAATVLNTATMGAAWFGAATSALAFLPYVVAGAGLYFVGKAVVKGLWHGAASPLINRTRTRYANWKYGPAPERGLQTGGSGQRPSWAPA